MSIYIISDLHLKQSEPEVFTQFQQFLKNITKPNNSLYILGDFFEYWIGDDTQDNFYLSVIQKLKYAYDLGLKIYFIHGNRDFLIGSTFAAQTGIKLLHDPFYLNWQDKKIALMHGDLLCREDKNYLRYRKIVQSKWFKAFFLHLPYSFRALIANCMRKKSQNNKHYQLEFDATSDAIDDYAKDCDILIHGHTHKLNIHKHSNKLRYVLGDWHCDQFSYIVIDDKITLFDCGVPKNA